MMHEDVDDDEEDIILDRRKLIHQPNDLNSTSNSGPILLGVNRFDIKVYDDPIKLSQTKIILLATTCISIGMFTGLLGPTFPFLSQHMPADTSAIIWLIAMKAIGFLIGTFLSVYLYSWFNTCCLLGLSCIAISFGICSLPLIADLATFYLTSFVLGIGLAISYNGIDTLYNRIWTRPSLASVRWLHLLIAFGAILSVLMLFPSTISNKNENLLTTTTTTAITQSPRVRRLAESEIANFLASMSPNDMESNLNNQSYDLNLTTEASLPTTPKLILKPVVVDTGSLRQSLVAKPTVTEPDPSNSKLTCNHVYCCYHYNITNQNETLPANKTFSCDEKTENQSNDCKDVIKFCQTSICSLNTTDIRCRVDKICENEKQSNCSIQSIEAATHPTTTTDVPTTSKITTPIPTTVTTTTTTTTTTTIQTTTLPPTTIPTTTLPTTTIPTTTLPTTTVSTTHRNKPSMAESDTDDLSENLFYKKLRSYFQSITSINLIYLFLAFIFFLLGIFYSTLAMRGEGINTSSSSSSSSKKLTTINPLSLLFGSSHQTMNNSNRLSLLSDHASLKFVLLLMLFYFLLAGIESSCIYLTFLFGIQLEFQENQCLTIQFLFFLGLLLGRLIDILMDYGCFLFNTRITNRTKKQSDKFHLISIKFCILIRLILLFIICSTLSFSHLFQQNSPTKSSIPSIPSIQMFYLIFFLIGLLIASLPTLILFWIERDLSLNDSLLKIILITITISEIIFPSFLFYTIKHAVLSYLFYLFIGSCLLLVLFIFILYTSKKWQRKRLYRILPTSIDMEEINLGNHSNDDDNDDDEDDYLRNTRMNLNETKLNLDNDRTKRFKDH